MANVAQNILAKGKLTFTNEPASLPNKAPRSLPGWMTLGNCVWQSFISVEIFLAKAFFILVFYLVVKSNSCDNSSSWTFFFVILNVVPVLLFTAYFNLSSCVFVNLTLAFS